MTTTLEYAPATRVSRISVVFGWILSILPFFALVMSASMKLARVHAAVEGFQKFGYPDHILQVLGIVELSCAIIYLFPPTAVLGAILVTGYLGGAVATHARVSDPALIMPFLLGVIAWLGLYLRDRRVRELIPLRSK